MALGPLLGAQILGTDDVLPEWTRELRKDSEKWGGAPFSHQEKNLAGPFVFSIFRIGSQFEGPVELLSRFVHHSSTTTSRSPAAVAFSAELDVGW